MWAQDGFNEQDGVPFFTQRPIRPGSHAVYRFPLNNAGAFWYHSHFMSQYADGLRGALIVDDPKDDGLFDVDAPVLVTDWYHDQSTYLTDKFLTAASGGDEPVPFGRPHRRPSHAFLDMRPAHAFPHMRPSQHAPPTPPEPGDSSITLLRSASHGAVAAALQLPAPVRVSRPEALAFTCAPPFLPAAALINGIGQSSCASGDMVVRRNKPPVIIVCRMSVVSKG
ncbi:MAG: hypothetical protein WDW38_010172 [Sanguina aurantia]